MTCGSPWTPAQDELLRTLCANGAPRSFIAYKLDRSKNQIAGRIHRLGLAEIAEAGRLRALGDETDGYVRAAVPAAALPEIEAPRVMAVDPAPSLSPVEMAAPPKPPRARTINRVSRPVAPKAVEEPEAADASTAQLSLRPKPPGHPTTWRAIWVGQVPNFAVLADAV